MLWARVHERRDARWRIRTEGSDDEFRIDLRFKGWDSAHIREEMTKSRSLHYLHGQTCLAVQSAPFGCASFEREMICIILIGRRSWMTGRADFDLGISSGIIGIDLGEQPIISQHSVFWKETLVALIPCKKMPLSVWTISSIPISQLSTPSTTPHSIAFRQAPFKEIWFSVVLWAQRLYIFRQSIPVRTSYLHESERRSPAEDDEIDQNEGEHGYSHLICTEMMAEISKNDIVEWYEAIDEIDADVQTAKGGNRAEEIKSFLRGSLPFRGLRSIRFQPGG